jgi:hypothetical protein
MPRPPDAHPSSADASTAPSLIKNGLVHPRGHQGRLAEGGRRLELERTNATTHVDHRCAAWSCRRHNERTGATIIIITQYRYCPPLLVVIVPRSVGRRACRRPARERRVGAASVLGSPASDQESGNGDVGWKRTHYAGRWRFDLSRPTWTGIGGSILLVAVTVGRRLGECSVISQHY